MGRLRLTVALLALPLGATACGGSGSHHSTSTTTASSSSASDLQTVKAAVLKTGQAGGEHVALTIKLDAAGQAISLAGTGDFGSKPSRGTLHMSLTLAGASTTMDEVLSGTDVYVKSPLLGAALPAGKTWIREDLKQLGSAQGIDFSSLMSQDPTQMLAQLRGLRSVTKVGTGRVDGVEATHYRGRLDVSKAPQGKKIQALAKARYGPYDIWVGDDGYVHRLGVSVTTTASSQTARTALTMGFSRYGEKVTVTVPPVAQTVDATQAAIPGLTS